MMYEKKQKVIIILINQRSIKFLPQNSAILGRFANRI